MKQITKLLQKHIDIIEWWIAHPTAIQSEVAEHFGVTQPWVSQLYHSPLFKEEMERRLKEHWKDAMKIAQKTMIDLASQGDRQAAAYILDSGGYKPKDEIDLTNRVINIQIDD